MHRRKFLNLALAAAFPAGLSLTGCQGEPLTGPVEIKWDRDPCARCGMIISDRLFAAQLRNASKKVFKFDDFGCAVFFLEHQTWSGSHEFWVAGPEGQWLDATKAWFTPGKRSPMGYGYAAGASQAADAVSYEVAKKAVLSKGK